ncbi:MAG: hypothetical protein A3C22_01750 [Candidatus Levybacteria bacterium RIFCSPHIGHO2_02_FULL_37_10]|nr:MAG: hypothetical protein A3C22_01750 [Candidatus Levybacteria bacterium RIFCSPHIGHO2_02_FULL_37_10]OGH41461.1 MAG: hypothetical protein A3H79_02140 [Candidatus Levybacteria bacterium RIFCSPLOWO2_02_FULL_36_8b]
MNEKENNNNFFSGFVLGALVGAAVVFLIGTKKGKRLLKAISEEGAENISNILEKADKSADLDGISEDKPFSAASDTVSVGKENIDKKPAPRRFFRGISRHIN